MVINDATMAIAMRYGMRRFQLPIQLLIFPRRLFLIAVGSMAVLGIKSYLFSAAANDLTAKLRCLTFKAMLRQDSE